REKDVGYFSDAAPVPAGTAVLLNRVSTELILCRSGTLIVAGNELLAGDIAYVYPGTPFSFKAEEGASYLRAVHPYIRGLTHTALGEPPQTSGPKVSIVIIACNVEQYIGWAID